MTLEQVQGHLQAKRKDCAGFVRVPLNDEVWIKRVLDLGADGIIVPQVKTREEALRAVAAAKYPPAGTRSAGLARAHLYGIDFANYIENANDTTFVFLQVEHTEGVRNIDEIISVPGVDGIIIGPYDMSGSVGKLGDIQNPQLQGAIETVRTVCHQQGMPIGIFALLPEQAKTYLAKGFQLVAVGIDIHYLWTSAKSSLESISAAIPAKEHVH
jgi:2-keto-3-deoxy-L-rhamnonate aldolase RhmA